MTLLAGVQRLLPGVFQMEARWEEAGCWWAAQPVGWWVWAVLGQLVGLWVWVVTTAAVGLVDAGRAGAAGAAVPLAAPQAANDSARHRIAAVMRYRFS